MGPNPNGPPSVNCDRAIRYSRLRVRPVGPVGDFLECCNGSNIILPLILVKEAAQMHCHLHVKYCSFEESLSSVPSTKHQHVY